MLGLLEVVTAGIFLLGIMLLYNGYRNGLNKDIPTRIEGRNEQEKDEAALLRMKHVGFALLLPFLLVEIAKALLVE